MTMNWRPNNFMWEIEPGVCKLFTIAIVPLKFTIINNHMFVFAHAHYKSNNLGACWFV